MKMTMRLLALLLALAFAAAACGSDDEATTDTGTDTAEEGDAMEEEDSMEDDAMEDDAMEDDAMEDDPTEDDAMADGGLLGLSIVSIDFDAAEVVIANNGSSDVELDGYFLCNFPDYQPIAGVGSVAPGDSVTVALPVAVSADDGELGLFSTSNYTSPDAIQAYVEWGSTGHERSSVAEEAGIWDGVPLTVDGTVLTVG